MAKSLRKSPLAAAAREAAEKKAAKEGKKSVRVSPPAKVARSSGS